jgi:catechol 2,3-dioxygenase
MDIDVVDMDHVAIRVSDLERALGFYHDLLGLEVRDRDRYEAGEVPFVAVVAGGRHIHLVPTDEAETAPGTAESAGDGAEHDGEEDADLDVGGEHVCLLVRSDAVDSREDLDDLLAELREAGVEVEDGEPYERYGAYGNDWAAYVRDPDGRRVELKVH